jgi:two-component system, NtrC family, sensor histidine kinase KinB
MSNDNTRASLELLYHVSRELAGDLDLRTVLQRVLLLSIQNVGGERGSVVVLDDKGQAIDSAIVYGVRVQSHTTQQLRETVDKGLAGWVVRNRTSALITDTSKDERWLRRPDDANDRTGAKSAICVPVMARERLVGVLTVVHPTPGFFTDDHMQLIHSIADQAGITMLNARLYEESQRQARVMTALAESAMAMNTSLQLDQVLQRILDQTAQALRVEAVLLALIDESGTELEFRAATSQTPIEVLGKRLPIGQGIPGRVAQTGQAIIVTNPTDTNLIGLPELEIRSMICAPVHAQGKIIGVLEAINPVKGLLEADALLVMSGIGSLAGTAIHNAQLYGQVESAHRRYQELFEDSLAPIVITDCAGKLLEINRQAALTLGYAQSNLKGMDIKHIHQAPEDKVGVNLEKIAQGALITYESALTTQSGANIPTQVSVRRINTESNDSIQWIFRDISERKALDTLRDDLIAMIYHDLRSPLANVVSSLDVMETLLPKHENESLETVLSIATRSTARIQRLINSLLDIHRLEAGQPIFKRADVDPRALIEDAVEVVKPLMVSKDQHFRLDLPESLPNIPVDEDMIRRVLINLLENANKFTPADGKIEMGARQSDGQIQFWVEDTGLGIPPDQQEVVFEKYSRLNVASSPKGIGLGLSFCRLAVTAHGGKIWVESQPEKGSRFIFSLPIQADSAGQMPEVK